MTRLFTLAVLAGGFLTLTASTAGAQESAVLDDLYGRGVHAYFSHDSHKAADLLSQAIDNGSSDPRAFYFRGLALRNLGREEDAQLDFQTGARLEASGEGLIGKVSNSLQRVQGPVRLELEATRKLARLKVRNERMAREERRYGEIESEDKEVLRRPAPAAGTGRAPAPLPMDPATPAADPFGDDPAPAPAPAPAEGTEPPAPAPAPRPAPAPAPAADDPFGESPAPAPAPRPAPAPAPAPSPAPAADDPFGEAPAPAPAPPPAPAPAPAPAADDEDPFGAAATPAASATQASAVPPATRPGKATSSLFRAITRAFAGDEEPKVDANVRPALNTEDATDPFADDAPDAPAPAPPARTAETVKDPFE